MLKSSKSNLLRFTLLTSSQDVRKVWLDKKVYSMLNESAPLIGAPDAWAIGLNGTGVRIAILDTGIDSRHEDFFQLAL
jgi:subtilisin family serine protease